MADVTYSEVPRGTERQCFEVTAREAWAKFSRFMLVTLLTSVDRDIRLFSMWNPATARWSLGLQLHGGPVMALTPEAGDEFLRLLREAHAVLRLDSERETVGLLANNLAELMADIHANERAGRTYNNPLPSMCMPAAGRA